MMRFVTLGVKPEQHHGVNPALDPKKMAQGDFIFPATFSYLEIAGNTGTTLHTYNIGISTQNAISFHSFMARILSFAVHDKEICEHNIPDILFLHSFNLNSTCSARGNVSYLFFFLRDKHTTFYGRLHVLYVSAI
jgi:hypothetical protein